MRLLQAIGIMLLVFLIIGLIWLFCCWLEWVAVYIFIGIIFIIGVIGVYRELE